MTDDGFCSGRGDSGPGAKRALGDKGQLPVDEAEKGRKEEQRGYMPVNGTRCKRKTMVSDGAHNLQLQRWRARAAVATPVQLTSCSIVCTAEGSIAFVGCSC